MNVFFSYLTFIFQIHSRNMFYANSHEAIDAIARTPSEKNMLLAFDKITQIVKSFEGDIYGGYIRDWRICAETKLHEMNIRIDPAYYKAFINVMSMYFLMEKLYITPSNNCITYECKSFINDDDYMIKLEITTVTKLCWMKWWVDFDVNSLAENSYSLYVRTEIPNVVDVINFVKERICKKTFCLLSNRVRLPKEDGGHVEKAIDLINRGWTMDDLLHARKTWVVFKWTTSFNHIRRKDCLKEKNNMQEHNLCTFCHDIFKPGDIVINTQCNHNFHWLCYCGGDSGMKCWVTKYTKNFCPTCREKIFD